MSLVRKLVPAAAALLMQTAASAALTNDLVVHLPFDGTYNDISGRGNNGTPTGTPVLAAGAIGSAVFCSNTTDGAEANYVSLGTAPDVLFGEAADFSVSLWVQLNDFAGDPSFFGNKNWVSGGNRGYVLATGGDRRIQWNFKEDTTGRRDFDSAGDQLPTNTWVHVAMTVQRTGQISTYINGQLINQTPTRPASDTPPSTVDTDDLSLAVNIGNDGTGAYTDGGSVFHGRTGIDDFGLWRRELSAAEVSRIYTFGLVGTNLSSIPEPTAAAIVSQSPGPGAVNVSPSVPIEVVIGNFGVSAVVPASIRLTLNGASVTPAIVSTATNTTVTLTRTNLFAPGSTNSYTVIFSDNATPARITTNTATFVVRNYPNLVLGAPFASEDFEGIAEGTLPAGWSVTNATSGASGTSDLDDFRSDAYLDWVLISTNRIPTLVAGGASDADIGLVASDQYVNGQAITTLLNNQFFLAQSTDRSGAQIQALFSTNFNCSGRSNVFLYFHSAWKQNQDSMLAVEYSVDDGVSWLPAIYLLEAPDVVRNGDGSFNAVSTFTNVQGDVPLADGSANSGGTYGEFIGAPITPSLAAFLSPRVNDDNVESKRVEFIRLVGADNQARVKLRFMSVGTDSWYAGIDDVRFYTVTQIAPPQITTQPAALSVVAGQSGGLSGAASGAGVGFQWFLNGVAIPGATNASLPLRTVGAGAGGSYVLVASNAGGSVTSAPAVVTVLAALPGTDTLRGGLRAYFPFAADFRDASGNGNDAVAVGAPAIVAGPAPSGAGAALNFRSAADGSSFNYLTLGTNFVFRTNDFSVAFWARFDAWTGDPGFIGNKNWNSGGNTGWIIATAGDGRIQWNYRATNDTARPTRRDYDSSGGLFTTNANDWHHITVTFAVNGNATTYVDGDWVDSRDISPVGTGSDALALNIGQDGTGTYTDGGGVSANGYLSDLGIWSRVISQQEAAAAFQAGRAGRPLLAPVGNRPTIAVQAGADGVTFAFAGTPPFLLQGRPELTGTWINLLSTSNTTATLPFTTATMYFRVVSGATNEVRLLRARLEGSQESPAVTTPASGAGFVAIEGTNVTYVVGYQDLKSPATMAHIHGPAGRGTNAGVLINLVPAGGFGRSGVLFGAAGATEATINALTASNTYFNIHTTNHPPGEIRGQIEP
jgi:hypothetical protein